MVFMDTLPYEIIWEIFNRIEKTNDRNSISLACKQFYKLDIEQRKHLRVGCGLNPANEALRTLCHRFPNLNEVEVSYSGWIPELGEQLEDSGLSILSNVCPFLTHVTLSYCTFITDVGLSSLASCSKLSSLTLNSTPRITGSGLIPIFLRCKNIQKLHLISCSNIMDASLIKCLEGQETLQDLCIKNCMGIREIELVELGPTWRNLKRFHLELDPNHRYSFVDWAMMYIVRRCLCISCENMVELTLTNCIIGPGTGLVSLLDECKNLEKINLDMCEGVEDCDIIRLAKKSKNLRDVSLRVPSDSSLPLLMDNEVRLTDNSLKSLAQNCTRLESVSLSFSGGGFQSFSSFSLDGILSMMKLCPVKNLFLDGVYCFNNAGLEALCGSDHLQTLELVRCQEISDEGLAFVARYPWLRVLRLTKCLHVTDDGFRPIIGSCKLELLVVSGCSQVTLTGVRGAAKSVSYS